MKLRLLGKRLRIWPLPVNKTTGGIHLPEVLTDENNVGGPKLHRVLDVGAAVTEINVGDRVLCHSHIKGPLDLGDGSKIVSQDEVLAVFPHPWPRVNISTPFGSWDVFHQSST